MEKEWRKAFNATKAKVNELDALGKYMNRFSAATDAIANWNFEKCGWIQGLSPSDEDKALGAKVETTLLGYESLCNILQTCSTTSTWVNAENRKDIDATLSIVTNKKPFVGEVACLASSIILTSLILQGQAANIPATLTKIKTQFGVSFEHLPLGLRTKLSNDSTSSTSTSAGASSSMASSGALASAPASEPKEVTAAAPKKTMRKIS